MKQNPFVSFIGRTKAPAIIIFASFLIIRSSLAQYTVNSPYLQNPELAIGYVDSCAQFWLNAYDENLGGFFTNIDRYGNVITSWGTNKNMLTQARDGYGFVRAYMLTGNELYLEMAGEALDFLYQHGWDYTNGGWFSELDINGNPTHPNWDKGAFDQHYALLGISSYYEATLDTTAWNWLMTGYDNNENVYWDARAGFEGYYDYASAYGTNPQNKSFNASVDAITTHILYLYLLTGEEIYLERLRELADEIIDYMVGSMPSQAIGFVEEYDSDWNWNNNETMTIMGHVLKAAWCLGRIYQVDPDSAYIENAEIMALDVWNNGYDHDFGGPYKDYDRVTGQMLLWGLSDSTKAWWQMEQAITAGLELFDITGDSMYLQMADETADFFMEHFVDHEYGDVYSDRTRYGGQAWGNEKGSGMKAAYHSIETGYYIYLYGSLFYKYEPVTLHYYFEAFTDDRSVYLCPIAIEDSGLRIQDILLNGVVYTDYLPDEKILNLPAGAGGHFEITFAPASAGVFAYSPTDIPKTIALYPPSPNPFNPSTKIRFGVDKSCNVSLVIYNITGSKVAELLDERKNAGDYGVVFEGKNLSSGIYYAVLRTSDEMRIQKLLLIK